MNAMTLKRGCSTLLFTVAAFAALGQATDDKQATFFMGRVKYSSNDGNDCGGCDVGLHLYCGPNCDNCGSDRQP